MPAGGDILAKVAEARQFGILLKAIESAGLREVLASSGPFTLFAPDDESFCEFADGDLEGLFIDPEDELIPLVLYHIVPGKLWVADLTDGFEAETAEGGVLRFSIDDGLPRVNGVRVTKGDIVATNGVIHAIAGVLPLPAESWDFGGCERETTP